MSEDSKISVTIKGDGSYASPWIVAHGFPSEVRKYLIEAFDIPESESEGLSLAQLTANAAASFKALTAASLGLDGRIEGNSGKRVTRKKKAEPKQEEPKAQEVADTSAGGNVSPESEPQEGDSILDQIAAAQSVQELTALFRVDPQAFKRDEVKAALKARRAEIDGK